MLLTPTADILKSFVKGSSTTDVELWTVALEMLQRCFTMDEQGKRSLPKANSPCWVVILGFWREDRLELVMPALLQQIQVAHKLKPSSNVAPLIDCVKAVARTITKEDTLRQLNMKTLMYTRSEELPVRMTALTCAQSLWEEEGTQLAGEYPHFGYWSSWPTIT
jgi:hypothetical protein